MNKLSRIVLMLALVLGAAVPLSAQLTNYDPGDTTTVYYQEPSPEMFGGHWYYCAAYGAWGGKCLVCEKKAGDTKPSCIWASYSGRCECYNTSTGCKMYGTCEYHTRS